MLTPCSLIKLFLNINIKICKTTFCAVFVSKYIRPHLLKQGTGSKQLLKHLKQEHKNRDGENIYYPVWPIAGSQ